MKSTTERSNMEPNTGWRSDRSDKPNIAVDYENELGDKRSVEFHVVDNDFEPGEIDATLISLEQWANMNPPLDWPAGLPTGTWHITDWRKIGPVNDLGPVS